MESSVSESISEAIGRACFRLEWRTGVIFAAVSFLFVDSMFRCEAAVFGFIVANILLSVLGLSEEVRLGISGMLEEEFCARL